MRNDPNSVLSEILKEKDEDFRELQERLQSLESRFWSTEDDSERNRIRRQMIDVKERVNARLSLARSV